MVVALGATLIVIAALGWDIAWPTLTRLVSRQRARQRAKREYNEVHSFDPGRERRAEQRARQLLCSCVNEEEWAMYRDLGFIRVWGKLADGPEPGASSQTDSGALYAYLLYPHKPIVAYLPQTRQLLSEYCVEFPDETRPYGSARLPDSDDVLAKWMGLTGDERRLVSTANMHLPGRQVDPKQVRRDLWRLSEWERLRASRERRSEDGARSA